MVSRRHLLGVIGGGLLTGCAGTDMLTGGSGTNTGDSNPSPDQRDPNQQSDSDGDGVADSADDFPEQSEYTVLVESVSETISLKPGYYQFYGFHVNAASDLFYEIETAGETPIDVFITDHSNFKSYEERSKWSYYDAGSDLNTTAADITFTLGTERKYYLIVDHTAEGSAAPSSDANADQVTVDVQIRLKH